MDLFEAFSEDDDQGLELDSKIVVSTKRNISSFVSASKRVKTTLNQLDLDQEEEQKIVDEFEESVEKEYSAKPKNTFDLTEGGATPRTAAALADHATQDKGVHQEDDVDGKKGLETDQGLVVKHQVRHQVALPPNYPNYVPISKHVPLANPARTWPFTLDPFQRTAIHSIERGESVLVSAHTSAGKTVVAEYAIALSLREKQRVIYTSPIKALSNQKYRDLLAEFGDVGLMTGNNYIITKKLGDVTINPNATCLVMTTEILRSMLYRGSEIMREVAWVVFDEIHYMRDAIRGVVWEETLILLPEKVHFVFLSATIPNAMQFAEWICKIKSQPCHVVYTNYRPTPLQHYLFPLHGEGIHLVVDEKSNFKEANFQKAIASLGMSDNGAPKSSREKGAKKGQSKGNGSDLLKLIKMINMKNFHPVIVFSFSKKECEGNALQVSKLDFNTDDEKDLVKSIYTNAIESLNEDDRTLPQIEHLLPLLQRGIGVHHSGLLPILKEVIEILFQEGLLKVLFATETFSIGLNMPARTVVFTSVRKFDGEKQRWLSGGEYIQMSGRAGRRGLDDRGLVMLMIDQKMEPDVAKGMLKGVSDALNSAFHLTYTMILNLMRVDGFVSPEYMLEKSFYQFQHTAQIPAFAKEIAIYQQRMDGIQIEHEELVGEYYQICTQLETYQQDVQKVITQPTYCLPFLQPGRLVSIKLDGNGGPDSSKLDFGWGIIINFQKVFKKSKEGDLSALNDNAGPNYILDVLLYCSMESNPQQGIYLPADSGKDDGQMLLVPCLFESIYKYSSVRLHTPKEVKSKESRTQMRNTMKEVEKRFASTGVPLLDPVKDMRITDQSFVKLLSKIGVLEERKKTCGYHSIQGHDLDQLYAQYLAKVQVGSKIKEVEKKVAHAESVLHMDELKCRLRVLRRLGYTTDMDIIETKGRVACEISAGDELVITEMMFNGVFNDLSVAQVNAVLCCFTCNERSDKTTLTPELNDLYKLVKDTARKVAQVSNECKITLDATEYVDSFRSELMPCVFAWSLGAKFSQICKMTSVFEGTIIRVMKRLEELLRQMVSAARAIGNTEMEEKFTACAGAIKRDIVFANSLYL